MGTAKRTHCPDGRPLYRPGDAWPEGLATRTMLKRRRRRLAEGQEPVATYWTGREYAPLYRVQEADELPPMTAKQQARWDEARLCVRCGKSTNEPLPDYARMDDQGARRLHDACQRAERASSARVSHVALRLAASMWARGVLRSGNFRVLVGDVVVGHSWTGVPVDLVGADLRGRRLVDVLVWPSPYRDLHIGSPRPAARWYLYERDVVLKDRRRLLRPAGAVDADRVVAYLEPLLGGPLVWLTVGISGISPRPLALVADSSSRFNNSYRNGDLYGGGATSELQENGFADRWRDWMCRPNGDGLWQGESGLLPVPIEVESAAAGVEFVLAGLKRMAEDVDHPDGPAVCAVLGERGLDPCGRRVVFSPLCGEHEVQAAAGQLQELVR